MSNLSEVGTGRWDQAFGTHYSDACIGGGLIFVAGQLPVDEAGVLVASGDIVGQARQVFRNMERVLSESGSSFGNVMNLTLFFTDIGDRPRISDVRREVFGGHRPSATAVEIGGLAVEGALLEVNAIALVAGTPVANS